MVNKCKICNKEIQKRRIVCSLACNKELTRIRNKERNKANKGKTYEELYGKDKAEEMKAKRREHFIRENNPNFGGLKKSTRKKLSKWRNGKTYEQIYGEEKGKEMREVRKKQLLGTKRPMKEITKEKLREINKGITWEGKHGKRKANKLKKEYSIRWRLKNPAFNNPEHVNRVLKRNKKIKGKTYEQIYGEEKGKEMKAKRSKCWLNKNNPNWAGGKSGEPYPLKFHRITFKKEIREFFGNRCILCGIAKEENGRELNIHHIDGNKKNLKISNLCLLCNSEHGKVLIDKEYWKKYLWWANKTFLNSL